MNEYEALELENLRLTNRILTIDLAFKEQQLAKSKPIDYKAATQDKLADYIAEQIKKMPVSERQSIKLHAQKLTGGSALMGVC